ncbi:MAG TPA: S8 family peptidase [Capsulimonadaceae bacterium]
MFKVIGSKLFSALSLCAFFGISAAISHSAPLASKLDSKLAQIGWGSSATGPVSVIAKIDGELSSSVDDKVNAIGGDVYRHLPLINSLAIEISKTKLNKLASLPFVSHLSYDGRVVKCDAFTVSSSEADVAATKYGVTGAGVGIAVIDSGVFQHPDIGTGGLLGSRVLAQTSFVPLLSMAASMKWYLTLPTLLQITSALSGDPCGHGTHVAGILAGNGKSSANVGKTTVYTQTFKGIAPEANIISVQVLDAVGGGSVSNVIAGIQWTVANAKKYNIRVINLSLGHPVAESYTTDPLCKALEAAWKAGIIVVCAAGNEGRASAFYNAGAGNEGWGAAYGSISSPANDPYVITVGAMKSIDGNRAHDAIATYSSRGPSRGDLIMKPDIVAPGNQVISTLSDQSYLDTAFSKSNQIPQSAYVAKGSTNASSNKYFRLSGTSMAAPVVAGAAALMLQNDPTLTPDTVKARLMVSADKLAGSDGVGDPFTYGAGYLNIPAAIECRIIAKEASISPTLYVDNGGNLAVEMDRAVWGKMGLYGTWAIWGTNINDMRAVWGKFSITDSSADTNASRAVWGKTGVAASRAVWGRSGVWGDRAVWGASTASVDLSSTALKGE